jgi:hypothetical protein
MTLVASGAISIGGTATNASINLELGRAQNATSNMNESALRTLAGVPSGAISMSSFYGKSNLAVTLPNYVSGSGISLSRSHTESPPLATFVTCFVRIYLNSNGTGSYTYEPYNLGESNFTTFTWLTSGSAADCYAYMDAPSGDPFQSGTTGTSLVLTTNRSWVLRARASINTTDFKSLTSTLRIKNAAGTDLVAKALDMTAEVINE